VGASNKKPESPGHACHPTGRQTAKRSEEQPLAITRRHSLKWLGGAAKWVVAVLATTLIGTAFSPLYLPRLIDRANPNRTPVDINIQPIPRGSGPGWVDAGPRGHQSRSLNTDYRELPSEYVFRSVMRQSDVDAMNGALDHFAPQDRGEDFDAWLKRHGAADLQSTGLRLTFQGIDQKVAITGIRAIVRKRTEVFDGAYLNVDKGGGEEPPITMDLPLDQSVPEAPYFVKKVITVAEDETVTVDLWAHALKSFVSWDLVVDFVVAGKQRSVVLHPPYGHFRTSGAAGAPDKFVSALDIEGYRSEATWAGHMHVVLHRR
jgi:hypothetical protein